MSQPDPTPKPSALDTLLARLSEPSTWGGFAAACAAGAAAMPEPTMKTVLAFLAAFCGAWAMYRPENGQ